MLSLLAIIKWILEISEALKNYFVNQTKCSTLALNTVVSPLNFISLFSQSHLEIFNQSIQRMFTFEDVRKENHCKQSLQTEKHRDLFLRKQERN